MGACLAAFMFEKILGVKVMGCNLAIAGVTGAVGQEFLQILEERDLRYCFPVNLLRKWLAARFPLRKVREEI